MPKIKVRFRTFKNIPFAIEQFTGVQYRCRVCNRVFTDKKLFEAHLRSEAQRKTSAEVSAKAPRPGQMTTEKLLYTVDIHDHLHRDYLRLKDDIAFDAQALKSTTHKNKGD